MWKLDNVVHFTEITQTSQKTCSLQTQGSKRLVHDGINVTKYHAKCHREIFISSTADKNIRFPKTKQRKPFVCGESALGWHKFDTMPLHVNVKKSKGRTHWRKKYSLEN